MQPLTVFEGHFRAAEMLLKVYRLLASDPQPREDVLSKLRQALGYAADETLGLLLNDLFVGLVRERADVSPAFFAEANLSLLLRQAVVSACTAMDVFFPALLDCHLPAIIDVRQRNFLPAEGDVKQLFQDFRLKLQDLPALIEEEDTAVRWNILARRVLDYCREQTLSNVQGISAAMMLLGIDAPWKKIAQRSGLPEQGLRSQIQLLTRRRNDIIHRGVRPVGQTEAGPQSIDYVWTNSHVGAVKSVVLACDELAAASIRELRAEAGIA